MTLLAVLVPRDDTAAQRHIDKGSGIVADLTPGKARWWDQGAVVEMQIEVYFEGNRYAVPDLATFEARVMHAADRLVQRYPTVARGVYNRSDFLVVGTWANGTLSVTAPETLATWVR